MNDGDRKHEILQAEEAVRRLAAEMAEAAGSRAAATEAARRLEQSQASLAEASRFLKELAREVQEASRGAGEGVEGARASFQDAETRLSQTIGDFRAVINQIAGVVPAVGDLITPAAEAMRRDEATVLGEVGKLQAGLASDFEQLGRALSAGLAQLAAEVKREAAGLDQQSAARTTQGLLGIQEGHDRNLAVSRAESEKREEAVTGLVRQVGNLVGQRVSAQADSIRDELRKTGDALSARLDQASAVTLAKVEHHLRTLREEVVQYQAHVEARLQLQSRLLTYIAVCSAVTVGVAVACGLFAVLFRG